MTLPSRMSLRRIPAALHLQVRVAYATAWEALIYTHTAQAVQFVYEFATRVPLLDALDLYFQVVAVAEAMQEVVRNRALTTLELESVPPLTPMPVLTGWQRFRPDRVIEHQQYLRRYHEKTQQLAGMVGARAAEAVVATHVENAISFTRLLKGVLPVQQAADHYLREFSLPGSVAQMVWQRVQARVAGEELTAQYDDPPPPKFEEEVVVEEPIVEGGMSERDIVIPREIVSREIAAPREVAFARDGVGLRGVDARRDAALGRDMTVHGEVVIPREVAEAGEVAVPIYVDPTLDRS
jgi:hypothetical protein